MRSSFIIRKSHFLCICHGKVKVMHLFGSKMFNMHWTHCYICRFTGKKWSKGTYLIFLKTLSTCECATLERINNEASYTFLYVRKFGIVSPKSPMSSNQWARPCPLRALETRRNEHWRTMHRKSNGNPLVHDDFFLSFIKLFLWTCRKFNFFFFFMPR